MAPPKGYSNSRNRIQPSKIKRYSRNLMLKVQSGKPTSLNNIVLPSIPIFTKWFLPREFLSNILYAFLTLSMHNAASFLFAHKYPQFCSSLLTLKWIDFVNNLFFIAGVHMYINLEMLKWLVYEWHVKCPVCSVRHPYRSSGPCSILMQVECGIQLETSCSCQVGERL
jgi:hypothetical protein